MAIGWRWWNSSPWRAVHRRPCSSTKRQRPPSRSCTARRTAAGMWREPGFVSVCAEMLAGGLGETEAAGLEPFELLGDGVFDDSGEVGAGDGGAQEGLEPLELVAQPGAGGELDAVAPGGEGLDACQGSRGGGNPEPADSVRTQLGARPRRFVSTQDRLGRGNCVWTESERGAGDRVGARSPARRGRSDGRGLGQLPDESRSIGTGRQLGRELLDLALRAVGGPLQDGLPVVGGEVRGELGNGGEVEPSVGEHGEEDRVLARRPVEGQRAANEGGFTPPK